MTSSAAESASLQQVRRRVFLALFIALAIAVHTLEALLPNPLPWFRVGVANILSLCALFLFGLRALWLVSLCRIVAGSLLVGTLFGPGFMLSLGGGLAANGLISLAYSLWKKTLTPVGLSVLGAFGHVTGQLLIAWLLVVRHGSIWGLLPLFLLFALISGILNGIVCRFLVDALAGHAAFAATAEPYAAKRIRGTISTEYSQRMEES